MSRAAAARREAEADVLDSLRTLGESTVGELAEDTGRTRDAVLGACIRLVEQGRARDSGRVFHAGRLRTRRFAAVP